MSIRRVLDWLLRPASTEAQIMITAYNEASLKEAVMALPASYTITGVSVAFGATDLTARTNPSKLARFVMLSRGNT